MGIYENTLLDSNLLLFINNYLHLSAQKKLNQTKSARDKEQMNFIELLDSYSLLLARHPFDESHGSYEDWSRVADFLGLIKKRMDLKELVAHFSFSDFMISELRKIQDREIFFSSIWYGKFLKGLQKESKFYATYDEIFHLSHRLQNIRDREYDKAVESDYIDDGFAVFEFTEGCIDFCMLQNSSKLVPVLKKVVAEYLSQFCDPYRTWDRNILSWDRQEEELEKILESKKHQYGASFWMEEADFCNPDLCDQFCLIESLLKKQEKHDLSFYCTHPNVINGAGFKLRVKLLQGQLKDGKTVAMPQEFYFGESITSFTSYRIWKESDESDCHNLSRAKRRYIWEFCAKNCDKGPQEYAKLVEYVRDAMKEKGNTNSIHVTEDDLKSLRALIAIYSNISEKALREEHIKFEDGVQIEVKKP